MKLYVIRHGQSLANEGGFYAGQRDYPLTELGRQQAMAAGDLLKEVAFDAVYSSDLQRAADTARLALGREPIQLEVLREIDVGALAGKTHKECAEAFGEQFEYARNHGDFTALGGENREQLTRRLTAFLHQLEQGDAENVAVFCHAGFINATRRYVVGDIGNFCNIDNAGISVFEYCDGAWCLCRWNITKLS